MTTNNFIRISIFFALTAVIFGALGAHYLKDLITSSQLTSFKTGVKYQFFHALAILLISLNKDKTSLFKGSFPEHRFSIFLSPSS